MYLTLDVDLQSNTSWLKKKKMPVFKKIYKSE